MKSKITIEIDDEDYQLEIEGPIELTLLQSILKGIELKIVNGELEEALSVDKKASVN